MITLQQCIDIANIPYHILSAYINILENTHKEYDYCWWHCAEKDYEHFYDYFSNEFKIEVTEINPKNGELTVFISW